MMNKLTVGQRLTGVIGLGALVATGLTGVGLSGLLDSKNSLKTVFEDRTVPLADLNKISLLQMDTNQALSLALGDVSMNTVGDKTALVMNVKTASEAIELTKQQLVEIDRLWKGYMATYLTPEEKILAEKFISSYGNYAESVKQVLSALQANNYVEGKGLYQKQLELDSIADNDIKQLIQLQLDVAKQEYEAGSARYENSRLISLAALGGAIAMLAWLGYLVLRSITNPLNKATQVFSNIESGNFNTPIDVQGNNELSKVLQSLKGMQATLSKNITGLLACL